MEKDRWLLFFLIQILFQPCHFQEEQEEDVPVTSGCYDDLIKSNPTLKNRFSDDMLQQHCKKSETWRKQSLDRLGKTSKPLLSPAQLDWATNIWNCKDLKCLCGMFDFCKNFLKQIESAMAGGLGGFNATNFKGQNFAGGLSKIGRKRRQSQDDVLNDLLRDKVGKANRKEIRVMSNGERNRYFRALNKLKFEKIDNLGKYDIMVVYHTPEYSPEAHFCAAFLPFHRELLKSLEMALRVVEPDVALPYWDTTLDEGLPNARDSVLWSDDFFGNGNGEVISGPFANWTTIPDARFKTPLSNRLKIVRNLGASPFGSLMKDKDIDTLMAKSSFRQFSYCVDPFTELIHGSTHMWVGGHMLELRISPNDPSFFVFHTFVGKRRCDYVQTSSKEKLRIMFYLFSDYIWEQWRQQKQTRQQRESDYVNNQDACNQFAYGTERMKPFTIKVRDGLSNMYTDQLYAYEPRPVCSVQNPSCGSVYLFCDTRRYKCLSKIKAGGNCNGFDGSDICYQSQCIGGRCQGVAVIKPLPTPASIIPTIKPKPPIVTSPPAPVTSTVTSLTAPPARPPFFSFIPSTESVSPKTTTSSPTQKTLPEVVVLIVTSTASVKSSTEKPAKTINQLSTSSNTVWTPITVLSLTGRDAQPYPQAKIVSHDADHGFQFFGRTADPSQVPYYSGAAFAQILNPFSVKEQVESTVDVFDADDKKCVSLCINEKFIYVPCQPKVTLFIDSQKSDNVPYTPNFELAKFLNWNGNKRNPDKFLYLCEFSYLFLTEKLS